MSVVSNMRNPAPEKWLQGKQLPGPGGYTRDEPGSGKWADWQCGGLRKTTAPVQLQPGVTTWGLKLVSSEFSRQVGKLDFHVKSDFLKFVVLSE